MTKAKLADWRQAEKIFQPDTDDFFDYCRSGSGGIECSVLIPCGSEPIRSQSGRNRAADDPGEEAPTGGAEKSPSNVIGEFLDHLIGRERAYAQRLVQLATESFKIFRCGDRRAVEGVEMIERGLKGDFEGRLKFFFCESHRASVRKRGTSIYPQTDAKQVTKWREGLWAKLGNELLKG